MKKFLAVTLSILCVFFAFGYLGKSVEDSRRRPKSTQTEQAQEQEAPEPFFKVGENYKSLSTVSGFPSTGSNGEDVVFLYYTDSAMDPGGSTFSGWWYVFLNPNNQNYPVGAVCFQFNDINGNNLSSESLPNGTYPYFCLTDLEDTAGAKIELGRVVKVADGLSDEWQEWFAENFEIVE